MIIYKATNLINGKIYIGQSQHTLETRKSEHLSDAKNSCKQYFTRALCKHGADGFTWEVIQICKDIDELNQQEVYYIAYYNAMNKDVGYNLTEGGGGTVGFKHSEDTIQKISKALSGKNNPNYGKRRSEETLQKMRDSHPRLRGKDHPNYGKKPSDETKEKIRQGNLGKKRSDKTKKKISIAKTGKNNPNYGEITSEETKQKIRNSMPDISGKNHPLYGKHHAEDTIQKMRKAKLGENNGMFGRHHSEETKEKLRVAWRARAK